MMNVTLMNDTLEVFHSVKIQDRIHEKVVKRQMMELKLT